MVEHLSSSGFDKGGRGKRTEGQMDRWMDEYIVGFLAIKDIFKLASLVHPRLILTYITVSHAVHSKVSRY